MFSFVSYICSTIVLTLDNGKLFLILIAGVDLHLVKWPSWYFYPFILPIFSCLIICKNLHPTKGKVAESVVLLVICETTERAFDWELVISLKFEEILIFLFSFFLIIFPL